MKKIAPPAPAGPARHFCALAACALLLAAGHAHAARAQWVQPSGSNNINNTNTGNVGIGTANTVVSANPSKFLTFEGGGAPGAYAEFSIGRPLGSSDAIGGLNFFNPSLGSAEKRVAAIWGGTGAAMNSGVLTFHTWNAGAGGEVMRMTSAGQVGIGTATPSDRLSVYTTKASTLTAAPDSINLGGTYSNAAGTNLKLKLYDDAFSIGGFGVSVNQLDYKVWDNSASHVFYQGTTELMRIKGGGSVGIGTASPSTSLHVNSPAAAHSSFGQFLITDSANASRNLRFGYDSAAEAGWAQASKVGTGYMPLLLNPNGGNVGVGTAAPAARLHVAGNLKVDGNIEAKYQDVAEWVPSAAKLAAGTVVILDPQRNNHVLASASAYDTSVAGVVSEQPGLILGEGGAGKVKVATTGRVKVKVDATKGAIRIGDLLVTSGVAGAAMRSEAVSVGGVMIHRPGTIIGKALEPLAGGTGEILVLLSMQ